MGDHVTAEVVLADRALSGPGRRTTVRFCWRRADPLAVEVTVTATPAHPTLPRGRCVLARELLRAGLRGPAGAGMVTVRPDPWRDVLVLALPTGRTTVRVPIPRPAVHTFLAATDAVVAPGTEDADGAIGGALERTLSSVLHRS